MAHLIMERKIPLSPLYFSCILFIKSLSLADVRASVLGLSPARFHPSPDTTFHLHLSGPSQVIFLFNQKCSGPLPAQFSPFCAPPHTLPLTCAHTFYICATTSLQYFSFTPVSFIFCPPSLFPCVALSGSLSAPNNKSCSNAKPLKYISTPTKTEVLPQSHLYFAFTHRRSNINSHRFTILLYLHV